YAETYSELLEMCSAITRHLKPGCRFVTVNNNPLHQKDHFTSTRKYGFIKRADGPLNEGTPVDYVFFLNDESFAITNYHLSIETHELAFKASGFNKLARRNPHLCPNITGDPDRQSWSDFIDHPPIIFIECVK